MEKAVQELKAQGVIEKSSSNWSSAVVLMWKKDDTARFCVDYRALNAVTTKDSYPIPRIDDTLESILLHQMSLIVVCSDYLPKRVQGIPLQEQKLKQKCLVSLQKLRENELALPEVLLAEFQVC